MHTAQAVRSLKSWQVRGFQLAPKKKYQNSRVYNPQVSEVGAQSTSSIFDASSAAPSTSSSGGRSSSSPRPSSSSSMLSPSLIMRWMRPANCVGSSKLKPEVSKEVSNTSQIRSFTVLSDLSAAAFSFSSVMMECLGFTSMVFLETMYDVIELSR